LGEVWILRKRHKKWHRSVVLVAATFDSHSGCASSSNVIILASVASTAVEMPYILPEKQALWKWVHMRRKKEGLNVEQHEGKCPQEPISSATSSS
jgi:hypothetical protein